MNKKKLLALALAATIATGGLATPFTSFATNDDPDTNGNETDTARAEALGKLNATIQRAQGITLTKYTDESVDNFYDYLNSAIEARNNTAFGAQALDEYRFALERAIQNLKEKTVVEDTTAARTKLNQFIVDITSKVGAKENYTANSFATYEDALYEAKSANANKNAPLTRLNNAYQALAAAFNGLVKNERPAPDVDPTENERADYLKVNKEAQTLLKNADDYTKETVDALRTAIVQGGVVYRNKEATVNEIRAAKEAIRTAINALVKAEAPQPEEDPVVKAEKMYLENTINNAKKNLTNPNFTKRSLQALREAIAKGEDVLRDKTVTAEDVRNAKQNINIAVGNLRELKEDPLVKDAKKTLNDTIIEAKAKLREKVYTEETKQALIDAIKRGVILYDDDEATLEQISKAKEDIKDKMDKLVEDKTKEEIETLRNELLALIKKAEDAVADDAYTMKTRLNLKEIVKDAYKIAQKEDVTKDELITAKNRVNKGIERLAKENPDETLKMARKELEAIVALAKEYHRDQKYTEKSKEVLEKAIDKAELVLANEKADFKTLQDATKQVQDAINNLAYADTLPEEIVKSKKELWALANKAMEYINDEKYTQDTRENLKKVLQKAYRLLGERNATLEDITKTYDEVQLALDRLKLTTQETEKEQRKTLGAVVAKAKEYYLDENYTEKSRKDLKKAIDAAEKVLANKKATILEITQALEEVQAKIQQLDLKRPTEKDRDSIRKDLKKTIIWARDYLRDYRFTKETRRALLKAITNGEVLVKDKNATYKEMKDAIREIQMSVLDLREVEPKVNQNIYELRALLRKALRVDPRYYTKRTYDNLQIAIHNAWRVAYDKGTEKYVGQAADQLRARLNELELREKAPTKKPAIRPVRRGRYTNRIRKYLPQTGVQDMSAVLMAAAALTGMGFYGVQKRKK